MSDSEEIEQLKLDIRSSKKDINFLYRVTESLIKMNAYKSKITIAGKIHWVGFLLACLASVAQVIVLFLIWSKL